MEQKKSRLSVAIFLTVIVLLGVATFWLFYPSDLRLSTARGEERIEEWYLLDAYEKEGVVSLDLQFYPGPYGYESWYCTTPGESFSRTDPHGNISEFECVEKDGELKIITRGEIPVVTVALNKNTKIIDGSLELTPQEYLKTLPQHRPIDIGITLILKGEEVLSLEKIGTN